MACSSGSKNSPCAHPSEITSLRFMEGDAASEAMQRQTAAAAVATARRERAHARQGAAPADAERRTTRELLCRPSPHQGRRNAVWMLGGSGAE